MILSAVAAAIDARSGLLGEPHNSAVRLFNGFYEGDPTLVLDLYAHTLVIHDYTNPGTHNESQIKALADAVQAKLSWITAAVYKPHRGETEEVRRGRLVSGESADRHVVENGVEYAIDLLLSQDTSLYLDTRNLRTWARENLRGKSVLNTFAYTGSYGVAAFAGGARQVVQLDLNRRYLALAMTSYALNGFPVNATDFLVGDFFVWISRLKRTGRLFDCVFLDPPFFAESRTGTIDMLTHSDRLVNKVRPLIADGGSLVIVNNALFLSGRDFCAAIEPLCADGFLNLHAIIPVPDDVTGYPRTRLSSPPTNPEPFNHPTKIAILGVRRRNQ